MNTQLMQAIEAGDQDEILQLLAKSKVEGSEFVQKLTDPLIAQSIQTVCSYILEGIGRANADEPSWNTYYNTARMKVGLDALEDNPSLPVFVQTMMMIAYALANGD